MKRKPRMRGSVSRPYKDPHYIAWRKAVFARDRCVCQLCKTSGKCMHAHHIKRWTDNPTLRFAVSNGITLCVVCHKRVTGNEEAFAALFITLLGQKRG